MESFTLFFCHSIDRSILDIDKHCLIFQKQIDTTIFFLINMRKISILLGFVYVLTLSIGYDAQFVDEKNTVELIQSILSGKKTYKSQSERTKPVALDVTPGFYGNWTYRSFMNHPDPTLNFNDLYFALATLELTESKDTSVLEGRLIFTDEINFMSLKGSIHYGYPYMIRLQGVGATPNIMNYTYDYLGFLTPAWPHGINQRPSIVGSVIRTLPHDIRPAGEVASFIAVKRNRS